MNSHQMLLTYGLRQVSHLSWSQKSSGNYGTRDLTKNIAILSETEKKKKRKMVMRIKWYLYSLVEDCVQQKSAYFNDFLKPCKNQLRIFEIYYSMENTKLMTNTSPSRDYNI